LDGIAQQRFVFEHVDADMDRVSQALLGHLHQVFDPDPAAVLALRVRHNDHATWSVTGDTLTLQVGETLSAWNLNNYTLASLADALTAAGFEVPYLNATISHYSALTLLEGSGTQNATNGDHLSIPTSPLTLLLAALGKTLGDGRAAIPLALAQLILPDATNEWADLFGEIFGIPRRGTLPDNPYRALAGQIVRYNPSGTHGHQQALHLAWECFFGNLLGLPPQAGESPEHYHDRLIYEARQRQPLTPPPVEGDAVYTARISQEVRRARSSPAAILSNIQRLTGHILTLWEPWRELHVLSQSPLSGSDHLQGAPIYEYHRLQLVAQRGIDWTPVLREADADRPAGTLMLPPATKMPPFTVTVPSVTLTLGRAGIGADELRWNAYGRLSVDLTLSAYIPPPMTEMGVVGVKALTTLGLRGPYEYLDQTLTTWYGNWGSRTWGQDVVIPNEMYPPHEIA
jgi:hypothetical protein